MMNGYKKEFMGKLPTGEEIYSHTVSNGQISISVLDYGATLHRFIHNGVDLVCGYDTIEGYLNGSGCVGGTIGRYANRITDGRITIDGIDIRDIPKDTLRHAIAIVLQDTVLFSDTVAANIKYGKLDATDERMERAAYHARVDKFIDRLPERYDTVLAESGSDLSAGQRQLLAIARAVLADPKILILDEATSSVDTRTEMHIQQAMVSLMRNRTSLIIAHRLSTIRDADKIVVVKDGRIAEAGNHEELLALGGEYHKLYRNQFAGIAT